MAEAKVGGSEVSRYGDDAACWQAVQFRDREAVGAFYYAVLTTGVYCLPSCGARQPRRENVRFYSTPREAERSGFRPCKRCRPNERGGRWMQAVMEACRILEFSSVMPTLDELADSARMSSSHFHRTFKQIVGVTPKAYANAVRAARVQEDLSAGRPVTAAMLDAGYGSNGRFYESAGRSLGMTPSTYRTGGAGMTIRFAVDVCSLGCVLVAATDRGVCAILLGDDPESLARDLQNRFSSAKLIGADSEFRELLAAVIGLIEEPAKGRHLPLDIRGTAFQQRVWDALQRIPTGSTASYTEVARQIGMPSSARAVARACASNSIAVAIPCHRVIRADSVLSGYRWGVERKAELLRREGAIE